MFKSFDVITESMDAFLNEAKITKGNDIFYNFEMLPPAVKERAIKLAKEQNNMDKDEYLKYVGDSYATYGDQYKFSNSGKDLVGNTIKMALEGYDKDKDLAVLAATDMVKAYNELINGHVDNAIKVLKKTEEDAEKFTEAMKTKGDKSIHEYMNTGTNAVNVMLALMANDKAVFNMTDEEVRKVIIDALYEPTDDPEKIKRIIKMRLNYNKAMIKMFTVMLQANWNILGMSKDQALALVEDIESDNQETRQMGIKQMKDIIDKNEKKFDNGKYIDLRPLGAGCIFITPDKTGFDSFLSIDRLLQISLRYDAIVFGHGSSETKESNKYRIDADKHAEAINKKLEDMRADLVKLQDDSEVNDNHIAHIKSHADKLEKYIDKIKNADNQDDKTNDQLAELLADYDKHITDYSQRLKTASSYKNDTDKLEEKIDQLETDMLTFIGDANEKYVKLQDEGDGHKEWMVQQIYTTKGGPFVSMDDCVRQLIKEGFKKIKVFTCNPGHHELSDDIKKTKGVIISHGNSSFIMENVQPNDNDPYSILEAAIYQTERSLVETCSRNGFHYYDDAYLDECAHTFDENCQQILTEGSSASLWAKIKEIIKSGIGFLVGLFKKVLQSLKNMIERIKGYFAKVRSRFKSTKLVKPVKSSVIMVEAATIRTINASNINELEKTSIDACASIIKKINEQEHAHIANMEKLQQFAEHSSRTVSENVEMEAILNMII